MNNAEGAGVAVADAEVAVVASTDAAEVVDAVISSNATDVTDTAEVVNTGGSKGLTGGGRGGDQG